MIIAVEGIDGAGKFTLVSSVAGDLSADTVGFPRYGASVHAQLAADALHGKMGDLTNSAYAMATLFALDRGEQAEFLRAYSGSVEKHIVLDRYVASNAAYSWARTQDESVVQWVEALEFGRLSLPRPDLQILLSTDPEEAGRRAAARADRDSTRARDAYERDRALQIRTFEAYCELARRGWGSPWLITADPTEAIATIRSVLSTNR